MIEVDCLGLLVSRVLARGDLCSKGGSGGSSRPKDAPQQWVGALEKGRGLPSSVKTTGLPLELPIGAQCDRRGSVSCIGGPEMDTASVIGSERAMKGSRS